MSKKNVGGLTKCDNIIVGLDFNMGESLPCHVSGYVFFGEYSDTMTYFSMCAVCEDFVSRKVGTHIEKGRALNQAKKKPVKVFHGNQDLFVYTTKVDMRVAALIATCAKHGVRLFLRVWDERSKNFCEEMIF